MNYDDFVRGKSNDAPPTGIPGAECANPHLFQFQRDTVRWALRRGRAAVFYDTGLGKTRIQLAWAQHVAQHTGGRVLILAPLAVASQTVREGDAIGVKVTYARSMAEATGSITIANYEMLPHFDASAFSAVVLDESSILKDYSSSTRNAIIGMFKHTPFRLACTATPSPNDFTELGNHAEFLGVMSRTEMLAMYFAHDGGSTQDWHIKGHGRTAFWRWVCSWAAMVKRPSDLGYDDGGYDLPALDMHEHIVRATVEQAHATGMLFAEAASTLQEQRVARRATMADRVAIAARLVARDPDEPWIVWCELNDESDALTRAIPGAVEVRGSDSREAKENAARWFIGETACPCGREDRVDGPMCGCGRAVTSRRVLVSKSSIFGWGLNWQHCARVCFVGVSHSFEQWYQAIRRCWRFGQRRVVTCHVVSSELEGAVLDNLRRKEADASRLAEEMRRYTSAMVSEAVRGAERERDAYEPNVKMTTPRWVKSDRSAA